MAKYSTPGVSEVHWVTTIASVSAPTAAELNAGVDLTAEVQNLPQLGRDLATVDVSTLASKTNLTQVGTRGGSSFEVTCLRDDDGTDLAYTTLTEDTAGFLVLARQCLATPGTFAVADLVDVIPATVGSVEDGEPGRNDADFFTANMVNTAEPNRRYSVAT